MKKINYARDLLEGPWDDATGEFFPKTFTKPPNQSRHFIHSWKGLGNVCRNAESYIAWIVIETIGPENGCERDSYSTHFITN